MKFLKKTLKRFLACESFKNFVRQTILLKHTTVVSPNEGTVKFYESGSNKKNFPLFIRFPYFKNFDEISPKSLSHVLELAFQTIVVKI